MTSLVNRTLFGKRHQVTKEDAAKIAKPSTTFPSAQFKESIKYLAYGSNLSAETFLGRRGIKPLSQVNVRVPSLTLSFDLAGVPYVEPRFANVRPHEDGDQELYGVVYEVTQADYRTILTTEGGYSVIDVQCFPLTPIEGLESFESKTLIVPGPATRRSHPGVPSQRYLTLLLNGAQEHHLPDFYQTYIRETGYYQRSTLRQKIGQVAVPLVVLPGILLVFFLRTLLSDKTGKGPHWLMVTQRWAFQNVWVVYDHVWKPIFGDGENDKAIFPPSKQPRPDGEVATETDALLVHVEEAAANAPETLDGESRA